MSFFTRLSETHLHHNIQTTSQTDLPDEIIGPENSPQFRALESELGRVVSVLEKKCSKLEKGAKKYIRGIQAFSTCQQEFAETFAEFSQGPGSEHLNTDTVEVEKIIDLLRAQSHHTGLLKTKIELALVTSLEHRWLAGLLVEGKVAKAAVGQRRSNYEAARNKVQGQGLSKGLSAFRNKSVNLDHVAELENAEALADQSRCCALKKYYEIKGRQSYDFLRMITQTLQSHAACYERQARGLSSLKDTVTQLQDVADQMEELQNENELEVAEKIANFQENVHLQKQKTDNDADYHSGQADLLDTGSQLGDDIMSTTSTSPYMRHRIDPEGGPATVVKQGNLIKRSSKGWGMFPKQYFFKLHSNGTLTYERYDRDDKNGSVHLKLANVKQGGDEQDRHEKPYCFRVISPHRTLTLQAASEQEMRGWMKELEAMTMALLSVAEPMTPPENHQNGHRRQRTRTSSVGSASDFTVIERESVPEREQFSWQTLLPPLSQSSKAVGSSNWRDVPNPKDIARNSTSSAGNDFSRQSSHSRRNSSAGSTSGSGSGPNSGETIDVLRRVDGNKKCADCGAHGPEWASKNLGALLCIQCIGVHRNLSTDISKTQGVTLDGKWDAPGLMDMMTGLGNTAVNSVFEENIADTRSADMPRKPKPNSSMAERQAFIVAKYKNRAFAAPSDPSEQLTLHLDMVRALRSDNLIAAYRAYARGAPVNVPLHLQFARLVMMEADELYPPQSSPDEYAHLDEKETGGEIPSLIFAACKSGSPRLFEFLLQNGANMDSQDNIGRTPLHYAAIHSRPELIQYLVSRGAARDVRDGDGVTAYEIATNKKKLERRLCHLLCP